MFSRIGSLFLASKIVTVVKYNCGFDHINVKVTF